MPNKKKKFNARFPPARIKKIMQKDEEVGKVAAAVPVLISKALEHFIQGLLVKASQQTLEKNAKTLTTSHIHRVGRGKKRKVQDLPSNSFSDEESSDNNEEQEEAEDEEVENDLENGSGSRTTSNPSGNPPEHRNHAQGASTRTEPTTQDADRPGPSSAVPTFMIPSSNVNMNFGYPVPVAMGQQYTPRKAPTEQTQEDDEDYDS